jgi:hypothetical protein
VVGDPLMVYQQPKIGDADLDGETTLADYMIWKFAFNDQTSTADWINGDFDGDGAIDLTDFYVWKDGFNQPTAGSGTAGPVPEPGSLVLVLVALATGCLLRRRCLA